MVISLFILLSLSFEPFRTGQLRLVRYGFSHLRGTQITNRTTSSTGRR